MQMLQHEGPWHAWWHRSLADNACPVPELVQELSHNHIHNSRYMPSPIFNPTAEMVHAEPWLVPNGLFIESAKKTNASGRSYTNPSKEVYMLIRSSWIVREKMTTYVKEVWSVEPHLIRCLINQLAVVLGESINTWSITIMFFLKRSRVCSMLMISVVLCSFGEPIRCLRTGLGQFFFVY